MILKHQIIKCTPILQYVFSMFMQIGETYRLMEQLANMAMRQLMLEGGFEETEVSKKDHPRQN